MTRPTGPFPNWATNANYASGPDAGNPSRLEPTTGELADGHHPEGRPAANKMNWLQGKQGDWLAYLYERQRTLPLHNVRSSNPVSTDTVSTASVMALVWRDQPAGVASARQWSLWYFGSTTDYKFSQDGYNWDESPLNDSVQYYEAVVTKATNPSTIVMAHGSSETIRRSTDGTTWSDASSIGVGAFEFIAMASEDGNIVAVSTDGLIQYSTDNGDNWSTPGGDGALGGDWTAGSGNAAQLSYYGGRAIMCQASGSNDELFLYSDDDGTNWTEVTVADKQWRGVAGGDVDGQTVWLAMTDDNPAEIWRSVNNGITWSQISSPTGFMASGTIRRKIFYHEGLFVCLGNTVGRLWYTADGGDSWTPGVHMQPRRYDLSGVLLIQNWAQGGGGFAAVGHQNATRTVVTQTLQLGDD